jgi:hypothetical protein
MLVGVLLLVCLRKHHSLVVDSISLFLLHDIILYTKINFIELAAINKVRSSNIEYAKL